MLLPGAEGTNMQLINHVIAQHLSPDDMMAIAKHLDFEILPATRNSMARELVDGARRHFRLDALYRHVKGTKPQLDLTTNIYELLAYTFTAEQILELCRLSDLDVQEIGFGEDERRDWTADPYFRRQKAQLIQEQSGVAALLEAIGKVRPHLDLSAFGSAFLPSDATTDAPVNPE
jgi:hypothetical protein